MMKDLFKRLLVLIFFLGFFSNAQAELTIEITKGVETAIPIAVVPFGWQGQGRQPAVDFSAVINSDLSRSGLFKLLPERDMLSKPTEAEKVKFRNWQALGQEYLVIGQLSQTEGQYQVQFQLFDVYKGVQLSGFRFNVAAKQLRRSAHHISDLVYQKLTGKKGFFTSRIAYITSVPRGIKRKLYQLVVADADGYNPKVIATSPEPLMSPAWSPDGKKIAYVSFENKRSAIYIQQLATGKRKRVAAYKGINGAPAFSSDGVRLAITLSKDGSPDIYVLNLLNGLLLKVTKSYAIDTEPSWSPDGKTLIYTSDRGGKPQLYKVSSTGGRSQRLTFDGDYNARGRFSNDGKSIAMVHANHGDYRIAVMDLATRTINVLTAGPYDESPSFSANGELILYAYRNGKKGQLSAVSVDGKMQQKLSFESGDVREPAWSP